MLFIFIYFFLAVLIVCVCLGENAGKVGGANHLCTLPVQTLPLSGAIGNCWHFLCCFILWWTFSPVGAEPTPGWACGLWSGFRGVSEEVEALCDVTRGAKPPILLRSHCWNDFCIILSSQSKILFFNINLKKIFFPYPGEQFRTDLYWQIQLEQRKQRFQIEWKWKFKMDKNQT